jgi:hypothetical protein
METIEATTQGSKEAGIGERNQSRESFEVRQAADWRAIAERCERRKQPATALLFRNEAWRLENTSSESAI